MPDNTDLPIGLSALPVTDWLDLLAELPPEIAGKQLNQTLQQLRAGAVNAEVLLPVLVALTPAALNLWQTLAIQHIKGLKTTEDQASPLNTLALQIIKQLSVLYFRVIENSKSLDKHGLEIANYYALQVAGHCQCALATFHEAPSETLWRKTAEIYRLAIQHLWLDRNHSVHCKAMDLTPSILTALKRNILFAITAPRFYDEMEVQQLFAFANRYHHLIDLEETAPTPGFSFYWPQTGEEPCAVRQFNATLPKGYVAINTARLGNALQQKHLESHLAPMTESQLALQFTAYLELFQSIRPGSGVLSRIVLGLNEAISFVQDVDKRNNIQQVSFGESFNSRGFDDLSLVPLDTNNLSPDEQPINPFGPTQGGSNGKITHIYETPKSNYLIAEGQLLGCLTGDLVVIHNQQRRELSLAVVRQQMTHGLTRTPHNLFEKIPGELSTHTFNSGTGKQQCLMLRSANKTELFLPASKYQIDSKIIFSTGRAVFLSKCLESNNYFARFEITPR